MRVKEEGAGETAVLQSLGGDVLKRSRVVRDTPELSENRVF